MLLKLLPFLSLAAAAAINDDLFSPRAAAAPQRSCGAQPPTEFINATHRIAVQEAADQAAGIAQADATITVDMYFHIIASSNKLADGYATQAMVDKQVQAMNAAYNPQGVTFNFRGADWTINKTWANGTDEVAMGNKLRKGSYSALNLYFVKVLGDHVLGYCYFPYFPKPQPGTKNFAIDGCKVVSWSMPGGSPGGAYNLGSTAVHETGHWFGLLHPFQNGICSGRGDYVADTPLQSTPSFGCQPKKDSCPKQPGLDSVHNFMDYSDDSCYTGFTPGQKKRLFNMWKEFRG